MWSCEVSVWLLFLMRLICVLLYIRSIIRLRGQIILKHNYLNLLHLRQWLIESSSQCPNALSLYFFNSLHCQLLFFQSSFVILCSYSVLLKPNAWLQFRSPMKSCFCNFRSGFYFCIFPHINLFTRVSCALFFLTRFKPPSLLSWLLPTSLPFSCLTLSGLVSFITGNIAVGSFFFHKPLLLLFSLFFCLWQHSLPNNSYSNFPTSYHYSLQPFPLFVWHCMLSELSHISDYTTEML